MWRAEDEALLARLENERILERLWRAATGKGAPFPSRRAAGLMAQIGRLSEGRALREQANRGELGPLANFIARAPLVEPAEPTSELPPELLHHLALYLERVADAMCDAAPADASDARVRSLSAWLVLVRQRVYLRELAQAVAGPALPTSELDRAVDRVALDGIDALGREAEEGARGLSNRALCAWQTLARVSEACLVAAMSEQDARPVIARAETLRRHVLESALEPIAEAMSEASARGTLSEDALGILRPAASLWSWAARDETVERFVVDHVGDAAWELYRSNRWDDLRALLAPLVPLVDHLCERISDHGEPLGYLASCAHMLVFRAETASTLTEQIALSERALSLCPAHRNAQIVLCSYLCRRAAHEMDRTVFFVSDEAIADIEATLARAEKLNASSKSLEEAKRRLTEFRRRVYRRPS